MGEIMNSAKREASITMLKHLKRFRIVLVLQVGVFACIGLLATNDLAAADLPTITETREAQTTVGQSVSITEQQAFIESVRNRDTGLTGT